MEAPQSQASGSAFPVGGAGNERPKTRGVYVEQDWQKVDVRGLHDDLEWAAAEGDDPEQWECVACNKTFRSEAAWDSHERSKKHMKQVEALRREMQAEGDELDLGAEAISDTHPEFSAYSDDTGQTEPPVNEALSSNQREPSVVENSSNDEEETRPTKQKKSKRKNRITPPVEEMTQTEQQRLKFAEPEIPSGPALPPNNISTSVDAVVATNLEADPVPAGAPSARVEQSLSTAPAEDGAATFEMSKRDKRRARQAKKAEAGEVTNDEVSW